MTATTEARRQLPVIVGGVLLVFLLLLLPDFAPASRDTSVPVEAYHGRILEIIPPDPASTEEGTPPVATARVEIIEGDRSGEILTAYMEGPGGSQLVADYRPGDEVVVTITQNAVDAEPYVAVADRWRIVPLQLLVGLFAAAVVAVGGWRGARALVALGLTITVILKIILPLILQGVPPLPMAVVGATAITAATILLTEGRSLSSLSAILGTAGSLAVAGLLAAATTAAAQFTYVSSDLAFLVTEGGNGLDLRGILLAAIILGSVGVLDDVTVTQAVVVDELAVRGSIRGRPLFGSALGIGRSHIGATVNTLFLAYVGASLPLLVVLLVTRQPPALVWNNEEIATEIVRTLAGSIGIVAAVPLTTVVATLLAGSTTAVSGERPGRRAILPVAAITAVVAVLLVATALLPRTQPARSALPTQPPFTDPGPPATSAEPIPSDGTATSIDPGDTGAEPVLAERGEAVPVSVDGVDAGTATVVDWTVGDGSGNVEVVVTYTTGDGAEWPVDATAWEILAADGTEVPLVSSPALPATLAAGEVRTFTLRADTAVDLVDGFIAYVDPAVGTFVFLVALE